MQHMHSSLKVETDHKKRTGQFLMIDGCIKDRNFSTLGSEELKKSE